jgi:nucleoside-diphosphate-sugar epimerase
MRGAEGGLVLHMAGMIHPPLFTRAFEDVNVEGTANLLVAARRYRAHRLIVMSSNSPFGGNPGPEHVFTEDSPYNPYMGYGRSKWRMEQLLRSAMDESNTPEIVIFRAPWFYGPGQPPRQTLFFKMVREGRFPILGDGLNRRSMGYVDSLALGMLIGAVKPEAAGQIYWIADERPYSMTEIVDTVKAVLRDDFGMTVSPRNLKLPSIIGDVARLCDAALQTVGLYHQKIHVLSEMNMTIACSIEKAKRELGFQPLVELREGMRRSVQWCLDSGISV